MKTALRILAILALAAPLAQGAAISASIGSYCDNRFTGAFASSSTTPFSFSQDAPCASGGSVGIAGSVSNAAGAVNVSFTASDTFFSQISNAGFAYFDSIVVPAGVAGYLVYTEIIRAGNATGTITLPFANFVLDGSLSQGTNIFSQQSPVFFTGDGNLPVSIETHDNRNQPYTESLQILYAYTFVEVPEPSGLLLAGAGLLSIRYFRTTSKQIGPC